MSWMSWCLATFLFAEVLASSQVLPDQDSRVLKVLSLIPDAAWTSNIYHRKWLTFPLNRTHPDLENLVNSQHMSPSKTQCAIDLMHTVLSLTKENWANQMLDATGKPESGILGGRVIWTGSYEECLEVSATPGLLASAFKGQYCWLKVNPKIGDVSIPLRIGICLPDSCDSKQMMKSYNEIVAFLDKIPIVNKLVDGIPLTGISCVPETVTWSTSAIGCLVFIAFIVAIVIIATAFDLVTREIPREELLVHEASNITISENVTSAENMTSGNNDDQDKLISYQRPNVYKDILLCFSAAKNGSAILDISPRKGQLDCIHGIRFLSMTWVILGHSFLFSIAQITNPLEIGKIVDLFSFQAILQAPFSVDTFFLLSGFLLTFLFLKDGASPKSVGQWIYFYIHRYIRLTPVYAILLGFWASIWSYLGSGPFWQYGDDRLETTNCENYWWWNFLYINNFKSATNMCMGWSWYLSNDMQFYVISPLFLIPLKRWPGVGFSLAAATLLASWIATFFISYGHYFSVLFEPDGNGDGLTDMGQPNNPLIKQFDLIYIRPYCRIGPYIVGMLVAYCFLQTRNQARSISKAIVALGWLTATACGFVLVYGMYHSHLGTVGSAFFTALSRSAWALALGWLMFACLSGKGGPVNSLLSVKYLFPLSRLTYCAYLIHPMIIYWYIGTLQDTIYINLTNIIMLYLAFLLLSYGLAFVASILFESPVVALEKQVRKMFKK